MLCVHPSRGLYALLGFYTQVSLRFDWQLSVIMQSSIESFVSESVASAWHWCRKSTVAWIPLFYRLIDSNAKPEPTTAAYNTKYNDNLFNAITTGRKLHAPEIHQYSKYLAYRLPASKLRHEWTAVMSDWAAYDRNLCDVKKYFHRNDSKKNVLLPVKMRQTMVQSTS